MKGPRMEVTKKIERKSSMNDMLSLIARESTTIFCVEL